jgi:hypothetical protein
MGIGTQLSIFHRKSTWRKKKNNVSSLKKQDDSNTKDTHEMENLANEFFKSLFTVETEVEEKTGY